VLATPDLVGLAQQALVEASLLDLAVDFQQAPVAGYLLVLAADCQQAPVVDFLPVRAEASLLDLVVDFRRAPVAGYRLALAEDCQQDQVADYQQDLATIGAVCLALIMAGKISNRSNILRNSISTSKKLRCLPSEYVRAGARGSGVGSAVGRGGTPPAETLGSGLCCGLAMPRTLVGGKPTQVQKLGSVLDFAPRQKSRCKVKN